MKLCLKNSDFLIEFAMHLQKHSPDFISLFWLFLIGIALFLFLLLFPKCVNSPGPDPKTASQLSQSQAEVAELSARIESGRRQRLMLWLQDKKSPLAEFSSELLATKNWKLIVALSAAESTYCRFYPKATANCWGVGSSPLWDFGDTLPQGIAAMDEFLETYPRSSLKKYARMSPAEMNGLYKQPAGAIWQNTVESVILQLAIVE